MTATTSSRGEAAAGKARRAGKIDADARRTARLFVAPAIILMIVVAAAPIAYAIWLSLHQYSVRVQGLSRFVGLDNYIAALTSGQWWQAVSTTFTIAFVSVTIEVVLGTMMAMLLNLAFRGRAVLRSVLLVPYAVLTVVSAITWQSMFDPRLGLVTNVLQTLGLPAGDIIWLAEPGYAITIVIIAEIWKTTPFVALLVLAGLQVIPADVYEAAAIDGATKMQTFFQVTLPLIRPAILLAAILRLLDALRIFDLPFVLTHGANGTSTMSLISYVQLRENRLIGEGSALSILTFATVMLVAMVYLRFAGGNLRDVSKGEK
ncbi:MAG: sugar ABC transporter permease [Propioniciclava sp.]|uniref:carbohydrate ABC transporter permease n=1 Tax=Propioniciclava sp. TaxID=2038686 RepID=UPI0039E307D2